MKTLAVHILIAQIAMALAGANVLAQSQSNAVINSITSIPPEVMLALTSLCDGCVFADFGQPWNPSDVVNELPRRRLLKAEHNGSKWIIQYEHGGIGKHTHTAIFESQPTVHLVSGRTCATADGASCLPEGTSAGEW